MPEVTHPIDLSEARAVDKPSADDSVRVYITDDSESSAELVDLVVEEDAPRLSVEPGDTLAGRYDVIEKVDHSGMGLVYKALDRNREKAGMPVPWVALKFAAAGADRSRTSPRTSTYLRQEFLKLSQLSHPNIVSVFDYDSDNGVDFLVLEWLEGQTLASLLTEITSKRIALDKAEHIVRSVARALAHAHRFGIVHGDVKPSNIFLADNRVVKLLDFGSSGQSCVAGDAEPHWATRAYASCEVLRGEAPQPRDDVFALGVTAYYLLSGERPFGDLDAVEARDQGAVPEPLPVDALECWPAVQHALRFDAADRTLNASEFVAEFTEPPVAVPPSERTHLEHIAYGAVAVALMIAIVAWAVGSVGGVAPDERIAMSRAAQAFTEGRLVGADNSAVAHYLSVLDETPDHPEALNGLERIAEHFLERSRSALAQDNPESAASNLATARQVMPDHYGIDITGDLIARYGRDMLMSARQAAETDPEQAEALLARASAFLPPSDPALEKVRAEFENLRTNAQLELLLQGIDQRILAERLSVPQGDSALDLLREARMLAPDDRQVALAADRIATALLFQTMFAISNGNLEEAGRFLEAAKALDVRHLALSRAQYELAKARTEALRAGGSAGS